MSRVIRAYAGGLRRLLRAARWLLLVIVLLDVVATAIGLRDGLARTHTAAAAVTIPRWMYPLVGSRLWGDPEWLSYFAPNALLMIWYYTWGALSLGALPLYVVWHSGYEKGWDVALTWSETHAAADTGVMEVAAGMLLPHGLLETPASWLVLALALRAGLVWVRPLRGLRRWQSAIAVLREFGTALLIVVPLLLGAALLETYASPSCWDRFVIGVGRAAGMASEQRVGRELRSVSLYAWSPDGHSVALVDLNGESVSIRPFEGTAVAVARRDGADFGWPSWSSDGRRLALASRPPSRHYAKLFVVEVGAGRLLEVAGAPPIDGMEVNWQPGSDRVGVLSRGPALQSGKTPPNNLWLVDPTVGTSEQMTHFAQDWVCPFGFSWSPDGRHVVLVRWHGPGAQSHELWRANADGTGLRQLTDGVRDAYPSWSPDGKMIAFLAGPTPPAGESSAGDSSAEAVLAQLCLIRADGTGRRDNVALVDDSFRPSWSPDSKALLYSRLGMMVVGRPRGL